MRPQLAGLPARPVTPNSPGPTGRPLVIWGCAPRQGIIPIGSGRYQFLQVFNHRLQLCNLLLNERNIHIVSRSIIIRDDADI